MYRSPIQTPQRKDAPGSPRLPGVRTAGRIRNRAGDACRHGGAFQHAGGGQARAWRGRPGQAPLRAVARNVDLPRRGARPARAAPRPGSEGAGRALRFRNAVLQCKHVCLHAASFALFADSAARPAHAPAHVYWAGWLRRAVAVQFVAGDLTSVERSLPHPGAGAARPLRVWGTPNRRAPAGCPDSSPSRHAPAGCRAGGGGIRQS